MILANDWFTESYRTGIWQLFSFHSMYYSRDSITLRHEQEPNQRLSGSGHGRFTICHRSHNPMALLPPHQRPVLDALSSSLSANPGNCKPVKHGVPTVPMSPGVLAQRGNHPDQWLNRSLGHSSIISRSHSGIQ